MCLSVIFGITDLDKDEHDAFLKMIFESASDEYLNPPPDLLGKYLVCRDFQIVGIHDTQTEATVAAQELSDGHVEIRYHYLKDGEVSVRLILPGVIYRDG